MIVSFKHELIFIKSMKTGSSSSEAYLRGLLLDPTTTEFAEEYESVRTEQLITSFGSRHPRPEDKEVRPHTLPEEIREMIGADKFARYTKIVNVRNPYELLVSLFWWWLWFKEPDQLEVARKADASELRKMFAKFLWQRRGLIAMARTGSFTRLANGRKFDAVYIRYENFEQDLRSIAERFGLANGGAVPAHKADIRSNRTHYSAYYGRLSRLYVRVLMSWELREFGYRFERG